MFLAVIEKTDPHCDAMPVGHIPNVADSKVL